MTTSKIGNWNNWNKGFTLFELLVAITIAALAMGLVISQLSKRLEWDLKSASRKLASTVRFLYNKSASENVTLRLAFDLEGGSYWVESTPDPYALVPESEESIDKTKQEKKSDGSPSEKSKEKSNALEPKLAVFGPTESFLLKHVKLPSGVFFKDVYAEHQIAPLEKGTAYIYFFPRGYVEQSVIHLRDSDDKRHYTLLVNPISGAVKIDATYTELKIEK